MKNFEKYKSAEERGHAFDRYINEFNRHIEEIRTKTFPSIEAFKWLELEAEEEKPLPCPFCGGDAKEDANFGGVHFVVCDCGYSSIGTRDKLSAISAHNRVAKAVMEREAK